MANPKNWNKTTPAAPSGKVNVVFQAEAPSPDPTVVRNVSAYMPLLAGTNITLTPSGGSLTIAATGGGGGSGVLETDFTVVAAADLTQDNFGVGTHLDDITIGSFTGVRLHEFGPGSDSNHLRLAGVTPPTGTSKWRLKCRVRRHTSLTTFEGLGLAVKDNGGKYVFAGWTYIKNQFARVHFSSGSSYDTDASIDTGNFFEDSGQTGPYANVPRDLWMRWEDDNTNLSFWVSIDGDYWVKIYSEGSTSYLSGTTSLIGIAINPNNASSASIETVIDCFSFETENF